MHISSPQGKLKIGKVKLVEPKSLYNVYIPCFWTINSEDIV